MSNAAATSIQRRGFLLVLSSPSGAGKTTLSRRLLEDNADFVMSVSATTRAARENELEGRDYYFVKDAEFDAMVDRREFLEHAVVFDHRYGTPSKPVFEALEGGHCVLFDIDWQGTQQLTENVREDVVTVFLLPPSLDELARRLKARGLDSEDVVQTRMAKAVDEISHWREYDYILVNHDLEETAAQLQMIVGAERLRLERQTGLSDFVRTLT
ncbi:MAG: guanylate kinase [Proteobacteria bacterium]|nr:guanylate kinase [Pseudomonadota bacterium]MDA1058209.1 guanylate kinase [Pseudomonadota bacterium]